MEFTDKKKSSGSSSLLAPGFRFHPTDEELVRYYLRRKVCGKAFRFDAISDIDIYKTEPWDLPSFSKLKNRDLEWYFFSVLDKKYGNGAKTNRATEKGYWKTTGKDRAVYHKNQIVGMKKTLVYHNGRAPKGLRTNWVMHEYRLADLELERAGIVQDAFVLCRVFQKSGSGPKNGEQYGAPFVEEEWEDDELEMLPTAEAAEEVDFVGDAYLDGHDLELILGSDALPTASIDLSPDGCYGEHTAESVNDSQKVLSCAGNQYCESEEHQNNLFELPAPYDNDSSSLKNECIDESDESGNSNELQYLLNEAFLDAPASYQYSDTGFIEANDLLNPLDSNNSSLDMLDEYLMFFDANDDPSQYLAFDPSEMLGSEDDLSHQALFPHKELNDVTNQATLPSQPCIEKYSIDTASPSDAKVSSKTQSDSQYSFIKHASQMLGNIHAPPAFASEFPSKEAALRLNSLSQSSGSMHVTAGMIQIRNTTTTSSVRESSSSKSGNFNIVLSFGFLRSDDGSASLESSVRILPGKTASAFSGGWFYFMLFWVLFISISFKLGSFLCVK